MGDAGPDASGSAASFSGPGPLAAAVLAGPAGV